MKTPVAQAIIFFGLMAGAGIALSVHAFAVSVPLLAVPGIFGSVISIWLVAKGVRTLRERPPNG
jgi:hypothetical protein